MPKFDPSQQLKKVDAEFEPLLQSASELEAFSKKREEEIKAEIAAIDAETVGCQSTCFMSAYCCMGTLAWWRPYQDACQLATQTVWLSQDQFP